MLHSTPSTRQHAPNEEVQLAIDTDQTTNADHRREQLQKRHQNKRRSNSRSRRKCNCHVPVWFLVDLFIFLIGERESRNFLFFFVINLFTRKKSDDRKQNQPSVTYCYWFIHYSVTIVTLNFFIDENPASPSNDFIIISVYNARQKQFHIIPIA